MRCTIIIATNNAGILLAKTLDAISVQECFGIEVLIQDCISHDNTISIANSYHEKIPNLHVESVIDIGIYDAWNKALKRANGEWIFFMGAGDTFCSTSTLHDTLLILKSLPQNIQYYSVPVIMVFPPDEYMEIFYPHTNPIKALHHGMCLPHQGLFHHKNLFKDKNFDKSFRISGDYDFICRTLTPNNFHIGKIPCVRMLIGGISSTMQHMSSREEENWKISRQFFPNIYSWKITVRWFRAVIYNALFYTCGEKVANWFADIPRILKGQSLLWSRTMPLEKPLSTLEQRPQIDLLVATLNRKDELHRLLLSLRKQSYKNFKVFIANQNDTTYLDALLKEFSDLSIASFVIPSHGVSAARNALLPFSNGDIIAFPDDDCWYEMDTLEQMVKCFLEHADAGILLGKHVGDTEFTTPIVQKMQEIKNLSIYNCFFHSETFLQFFRREVVVLTGDFDIMLGTGTGLPYGAAEDTDYVLRAHANRYAVLRATIIHVCHPMPDFSMQSPKKVHDYAYGRMYLLHKSKMPFWFILCNVLYPLIYLPIDTCKHGLNGAIYRWRMFSARCKALFFVYFTHKYVNK